MFTTLKRYIKTCKVDSILLNSGMPIEAIKAVNETIWDPTYAEDFDDISAEKMVQIARLMYAVSFMKRGTTAR